MLIPVVKESPLRITLPGLTTSIVSARPVDASAPEPVELPASISWVTWLRVTNVTLSRATVKDGNPSELCLGTLPSSTVIIARPVRDAAALDTGLPDDADPI